MPLPKVLTKSITCSSSLLQAVPLIKAAFKASGNPTNQVAARVLGTANSKAMLMAAAKKAAIAAAINQLNNGELTTDNSQP